MGQNIQIEERRAPFTIWQKRGSNKNMVQQVDTYTSAQSILKKCQHENTIKFIQYVMDNSNKPIPDPNIISFYIQDDSGLEYHLKTTGPNNTNTSIFYNKFDVEAKKEYLIAGAKKHNVKLDVSITTKKIYEPGRVSNPRARELPVNIPEEMPELVSSSEEATPEEMPELVSSSEEATPEEMPELVSSSEDDDIPELNNSLVDEIVEQYDRLFDGFINMATNVLGDSDQSSEDTD